ncbi:MULTISPECIES: hypothetical protein [unclassified Burkholderia]|uniref:hypothetical protein n=1 Tax=unclassified Burkholderia TaxID=2613784 RepID=UPI000F580C92|nr:MULTISPECIES: hypothetical protein [unclassified Burkholderia]
MRHMLAFLLAVCSGANAQQPSQADSCRDILRNGAFNQTNFASSEAANRAAYAQLCASSYQEAINLINSQSSLNGGVNIDIGYDSFGLNFGGKHVDSSNFSQNQFNAWKSSACNTTSSRDASSSADYLMQRLASDAIVQSWAQCMANKQGLTCWASPYGAQDALITLNWKQESSTRLIVTMTDVSDGATSRFDNTPRGKLLPLKYQLDPGSIQVPLTRQFGKSVLVAVNGNHAGQNFQCSAYIPSTNDFKLKTVVIQTKPQKVEESGDLGCSVQALEGTCQSSWTATAPADYKVCSASLKYTAGPTSSAQMNMIKANNSVTVDWKVTSSIVPFGPGRWVHAVARVVYVPSGRSMDDDGNACNI